MPLEHTLVLAVAGARLGKYELLHRLAIGGMGEVFLAREQGLAGVSRLVVVKVLLPELAEDPHEVALFTDEARISAQLAHPNIVQLLDFSQDGGSYFLVMEFVPGENLARLTERASRQGVGLRRELAVSVVAEVSRALDYAHGARDADGRPLGVVHRDISPHNILVSRAGDVKLLDFGIATSASRRQRTRTGVVRGKIAYMSPEQIANGEVDQRSDVFSLGTVLWEMTLLRRLFAGDSEIDTIRRVEQGLIPRPREIDPDYPEDLEAVVMTALAPDRSERFQNAAALEAALRIHLQRAAPVDRRDLGAWVSKLAPEAPEVADGRRNTLPAAAQIMSPFRQPTQATEAAVPDETPGQLDGETRDPRRSLGLWMAAAVITAGLVVGALLWFSAGTASTAEGPRDAGPDQTLDAGSATAVASAAKAVAADAGLTVPLMGTADAGVAERVSRRPARSRRSPRDRDRKPTTLAARDAAPSPSPPSRTGKHLEPVTKAEPAPVAAAPRGELRVRAEPYGNVTINGDRAGRTPLVRELAPGRYRLVVQIPAEGRTVSTDLRIQANEKTKCTVKPDSLHCR